MIMASCSWCHSYHSWWQQYGKADGVLGRAKIVPIAFSSYQTNITALLF